MQFLLGLISGLIVMQILSRDSYKVSNQIQCPDIIVEQPKQNIIVEDSFKVCMESLGKTQEKLFDCQKDNIYYRSIKNIDTPSYD